MQEKVTSWILWQGVRFTPLSDISRELWSRKVNKHHVDLLVSWHLSSSFFKLLPYVVEHEKRSVTRTA